MKQNFFELTRGYKCMSSMKAIQEIRQTADSKLLHAHSPAECVRARHIDADFRGPYSFRAASAQP